MYDKNKIRFIPNIFLTTINKDKRHRMYLKDSKKFNDREMGEKNI